MFFCEALVPTSDLLLPENPKSPSSSCDVGKERERATEKAAAAAKKSPALPKERKLTPKSKQQLVPSSNEEENRVSNPEVPSNTAEENKDQEEKELNKKRRVIYVNNKLVILGTKQNIVDEETEAVEIEDPKGSGDGNNELVILGAKQDLVQEETAAAENEDTKGGGDGNNDTPGANEGCTREGDGKKSENDEEDNEEDEETCVYTNVPFTDREKEKDFEIFVGGLDKGAVEEDLIKVFGRFGEIQATRIVKHPSTKKSKGFAFIRYATVEQAKKALAELKDGMEVLETLKSFGIEHIEDMYLPDDTKDEGKSNVIAFLEFSTHSDAMAAFQRLRKPDAVFGCDISAKVTFAQTSMHPSKEALSQVKTVYVEGLTDSWDEDKVKEFCKQYEGINNAHVGGDIKVKANLAKSLNKGRLQKKSARGGFKVKEDERTEEAGPSKMKGHAKLKEAERKGKAVPKLKTAKGGKPYEPQRSVAEGQGAGVTSRSETTNRQRNELPAKGEKRSRRDTNTGYSKRPSKKPRGQAMVLETKGTALTLERQGRAAPLLLHMGIHIHRDMLHLRTRVLLMIDAFQEPHAGFIEPSAGNEGRDQRGYGLIRASGYDGQGRSGIAYGGFVLPPYAPNYASYTGYEGSGSGAGYYPSSGAYPPRQAYY
ncbi:hypothetical protein HHK36_028746 [Tetracentron sinense]|uniref:RRM domain-containing protein n=1 Tax=Tetracentron sinense TaxID=13715 RepID=A0A834YBN3_TETSI|nr:hypothetical protein HHK36_028746 [Tetracentron sinense]